MASDPHGIRRQYLAASFGFLDVASARTQRESPSLVATSLRSANVGQRGDNDQVFSAGSPHRCGQGRDPTTVAAPVSDNERQCSAMTSRCSDMAGIGAALRGPTRSAGPAWLDVAGLETKAVPCATGETSRCSDVRHASSAARSRHDERASERRDDDSLEPPARMRLIDVVTRHLTFTSSPISIADVFLEAGGGRCDKRSHVPSAIAAGDDAGSDNTTRTMIFSAGELASADEAPSVVEPRSEEAALSSAQTSVAQACTEVE